MAQWFAVDSGQFPQLRNINDALAGFAFIEEGMRHSHTERNIALRQAGL